MSNPHVAERGVPLERVGVSNTSRRLGEQLTLHRAGSADKRASSPPTLSRCPIQTPCHHTASAMLRYTHPAEGVFDPSEHLRASAMGFLPGGVGGKRQRRNVLIQCVECVSRERGDGTRPPLFSLQHG